MWTCLPVWAFFLILRVFRIGDTAVPMFLNRPFNLYIDSGYLFGLYDLLKTTARRGSFLLLSAKTVVVTLGIIISSWYAWRVAALGLTHKKFRLTFLTVSAVIFSVVLIHGRPSIKSPVMARFGREIFSIRDQLRAQQAFFVRLKKTAREREAFPASLKALQGADVLLFIVESYGRIVFSHPKYRQVIKTTMDNLTRVLDRHGFQAVSSYLVSPTYGGSSWLAHSSLEFGLRAGNDLEDTALLRSSLPPLASYFAKSGYRTISVMPGTRFAYPEGTAFGYDRYYYARDFNYRGQSFGWAPMPDQFVLDWVRHHEFVKRSQPLFVHYVLISSHAAFSRQPQFLVDWESIGDGRIYKDIEPVTYPIYWPNLQNAGEAYLRSLDYDFTVLGDYFARYVSADTLIIIMGDHQPNVQLTGEGQPWSVPVHIISRNPRLLEPFSRRGYTPGLIPSQPLPHAGMETFLQSFLEDFR